MTCSRTRSTKRISTGRPALTPLSKICDLVGKCTLLLSGHSNTALLPENLHNCSDPNNNGVAGKPLCNPVCYEPPFAPGPGLGFVFFFRPPASRGAGGGRGGRGGGGATLRCVQGCNVAPLSRYHTAHVGSTESTCLLDTCLFVGREHAQVMWWNKGGVLRGSSPPRIAFFRQQMTAYDVPRWDALSSAKLWEAKGAPGADVGAGIYHLFATDGSWHLIYWLNTTMPVAIPTTGNGKGAGKTFAAVHIDYWNMTATNLAPVQGQHLTSRLRPSTPCRMYNVPNLTFSGSGVVFVLSMSPPNAIPEARFCSFLQTASKQRNAVIAEGTNVDVCARRSCGPRGTSG